MQLIFKSMIGIWGIATVSGWPKRTNVIWKSLNASRLSVDQSCRCLMPKYASVLSMLRGSTGIGALRKEIGKRKLTDAVCLLRIAGRRSGPTNQASAVRAFSAPSARTHWGWLIAIPVAAVVGGIAGQYVYDRGLMEHD